MEKRVDRNRQLYKDVDKRIEEIAHHNSNKEFESTNNTLKNINPSLFGGQVNNETPTKKLSNPNKKKIIATSIVFAVLLILIIIFAVVIYNATK